MANIMSLKNVRNKASRNGFDLSRRTCFTAKVGELLPVWWKYVLPGDSFTVDLSAFTRTQPVNTASYGRIREYYDFFFVPLEQLWNKSHTVMTQMNDNNQHATSLNGRQTLSGNLPALDNLYTLNSIMSAYYNSQYDENIFGFRRSWLMGKLASYLGYGQLRAYTDSSSPELATPTSASLPQLSLYPFLAYQKIYSDFFRFTQWESPNPSTFNVDWMHGTDDTVLEASNFTPSKQNTMFDLRYCNYQKDLFHGVMPNAQFGSTASVPISSAGNSVSVVPSYTVERTPGPFVALNSLSSSVSNGTLDGFNVPTSSGTFTGYSNVVTKVSPADEVNVSLADGSSSSQLSILALRQAEALQRWKEVAQAAEEDYKQQIQAHWGINVSDLLSGQSRYLGGINGNVNINEVTNTALTGGSGSDITEYSAVLAGKGIGSQNGKITFNSQGEYGVIMCIYHALPLLDYVTTGTEPSLFHVDAASFPIPEMDSIGMELLPANALTNSGLASAFNGYVPRYVDWKTDYDRCVGGFSDTLQSWIIPYSDSSFSASLSELNNPDSNPNITFNNMTYNFMKVNPNIVDPMFAVDASDSVNTDPLLCQTFFDVKVVRNLDVNGLPY